MYAWTTGLWPLLIGRLLWGTAWSGIWVGGNTIILDVTTSADRGRWTGLYQLSFFLGGAVGFPVAGLLTDWLGFHQALMVATAVTGLGTLVALLMLPETRGLRVLEAVEQPEDSDLTAAPISQGDPMSERAGVAAATLLYMANRFVIAGVISASLGLVIAAGWGEVRLGNGALVGLATVTGIMLGTNTLVSMFAAPIAGHWSDRLRNRMQVAALGLLPGAVGMGLLSTIHPWALIPGVLLVAVAGGSNQSLATALLGDVTAGHRRGRAMGLMHTFGDLSSAAAPLLVYAVLPWLGLAGIYQVCAGLLLALLVWVLRLARVYRPG